MELRWCDTSWHIVFTKWNIELVFVDAIHKNKRRHHMLENGYCKISIGAHFYIADRYVGRSVLNGLIVH